VDRYTPDLDDSLAWGDQRYAQLMDLVRKLVVAERGQPPPEIPDPGPFGGNAPDRLDLSSFGAVIFAGGFGPPIRPGCAARAPSTGSASRSSSSTMESAFGAGLTSIG
jgi:hypothetical protein